ncbi:MAG: ATP-binding protein [Chloroflexota bacterium]
MQDFEKLGTFYLGREYDLSTKKIQENLLLYDSRDLVTHAVVMGMTGSGKTGLCINMIEEAAIDGVPSILIDPKGDLSNLLLTFPALRGEDFLPWVNPDDANRKGLSVEDFAKQQASMWQKGLADWGEDGLRIQRLRDAAEVVIFTPGSNAGIPVSILKSFAVPAPEILKDSELLQERITSTVTSLLGLLKIEADPLQSREHILMSTIIGQMWQQGQDLDLATLIAQIQKPPVSKIGVLDLESFYSAKDRFALVMAMNNLLASPGFNAWMEGIPLDINQILHTSQSKPRVAIFSIAHLNDAERMFFVSMLLNQILGWMRTQPGTSSLRALVYMDEIFGYFPPTANPPSKQPLLTLLKQGRAFGVGILLATQNPVDLDYKGLSNTGTWFIGRLQTERDKSRVIEGLEGASASTGSGFDRQKMEQLLAGLGSRVFLMNNTHDDAPVVFQTRWTLSYLRGPLTRDQIKQIMDPYKSTLTASSPEAQKAAAPPAKTSAAAPVAGSSSTKPVVSSAGIQPTLPPGISQFFIPLRGSNSGITYQPMLVGAAKVHFTDAKAKVDETQSSVFLTSITDQAVPVNWEEAQEAGIAINDLDKTPVQGAQFGDLPEIASNAKIYANWNRDFITWLYSSQKLEFLQSPSSGQLSQPGESERDFRVRLQQNTRELRDDSSDTLRKKFAPKIAALNEKIQRAQVVVDREAAQVTQAGMQTAISIGSSLLGAFTGRKANVTQAAKSIGRTVGQQGDVNRAKESLQLYQQQLQELDAEFKAEMETVKEKSNPATEALDTVAIKPKKTDISVQVLSLVWAPYRDEKGQMTPSW